MASRYQGEISADLARARDRLAAWRRTKKPRSRIPEALWELAVELAGKHGLNRTARSLKLDYYSLKDRVDATPKNGKTNPAAFLELPPVALPSKECVIESGVGEGLVRIRLTGYEPLEIATVGRGLRGA